MCVCVRPQAIRNNSCEMSLNNWLYCFPVLPVIDGVGRCGLSSGVLPNEVKYKAV